ncbi:parathyroid hormone/parathyroid hormone-related peptide receptor [Octopus sinensis]|uniref:Parathyroid hormone/parathyroid hormone-related peptide receptor n=1 Tax=Octopus sinensis TaxID=2607531 RepID=A0A7E6F1J2_9MOLL|nr:parathyroid hormone/parathyroid hormone-related peptide receptor [Octopus sinensis]
MKLEKMIATTYGMLILGFVIVVLDFIVITKAETAVVDLEEQSRRIKEEAIKCNAELKNSTDRSEEVLNGSYCPGIWDGILCWPDTEAGTLANLSCPAYVNKFNTDYYATRLCTENGTWFHSVYLKRSWTNYTLCSTIKIPIDLLQPHMRNLELLYEIGYGLSLVSLSIAVVIMVYFRRLHCQRNTIHINLFISFILRAAFSFMKERLLVEGVGFASDVRETKDGIDFIEEGSHWQCKLFFIIFHYLLGSNYMWIFVEALYLHTLISIAVFSKTSGTVWYIIFGWGASITFVLAWVIVRITKENTLCWNTNPTPAYFWIMRGPILLSTVMNFIFFLNVVRILFTKLNAANSPEAQKFRRLAKSTLVLIPLFGIHYIVFGGIPDSLDTKTELVKLYFDMFFNSLQGFFLCSFLWKNFTSYAVDIFITKWQYRQWYLTVLDSKLF